MAGVSRGYKSWSLSRDEEGQREYTIGFLVETLLADGPLIAAQASGLPAIGAVWNYGNDSDPWAFCTPYTRVMPQNSKEGEQVRYWTVEKKFSTVPITRCQDTTVENPMLEPQKISGSFADGTKKVARDRNNDLIQTTSFEPVLVETPDILPTVRIEQNVLNLQLDVFTPMITTVNSTAQWGLAARRIRLAGASWERKYYGSCTPYYTRTFEFEVNFNTFDRSDIPNRGKKIIRGEWDADGASYTIASGASASDPLDYITGVDKNGNPTEHYLAASGAPSTSVTYLSTVEILGESNFFLLGIPTSL